MQGTHRPVPAPEQAALTINEDIQSPVDGVLAPRLASDDTADFVRSELDRVALTHSTFTPEALGLVVRASERVLR